MSLWWFLIILIIVGGNYLCRIRCIIKLTFNLVQFEDNCMAMNLGESCIIDGMCHKYMFNKASCKNTCVHAISHRTHIVFFLSFLFFSFFFF